ncbi:protein-tyrosine kinase [Dysgonomonas sp. 521]|uniref:virulence RhuM family protein n=1 Tax=Dysgonomonas sp. 521 TaxID=2302932 RepID=UPI0013CFF194|nr:virulence RhuM family protein [Dysgonomonas sp. 521]NDV96431.1 protein-tyrosine kinase [Dysgonomonas sp. 521]
MKREVITIESNIVHIPQSADVWMTQLEITDLFGCFVSKVNSNIRSILKSGVLHESDVCRMYHYQNGNFVEQYNLEMIIALSFRIQSRNAEVFRKWLTRKLSKSEIPEMLVMGIKNPMLN